MSRGAVCRLAALAVSLLLWLAVEAQAQRSTGAGSTGWCTDYSGRNFRCGTAPSAPSAPSGAGAGAMAPMFGVFGTMLNQMMQDALNPAPSAQEELQRQERARRQQEQMEAEAAAARQRDEEEKARIAAARERILRQLRPVDDSPASPGAGRELQVIEGRGAFGTLELKPRDLGAPTPGQPGAPASGPGSAALQPRPLGGGRTLTAFERGACSRQYLLEANRSFNANRPEEAAALSREAGMILTGEASPSGPCAAPEGSVPAVGDPVAERKQTLIMSALFTRISQQAAEYRRSLAALRQAQEERTRREQALAETRRRVEQLKMAPVPTPPPAGALDTSAADPAGQSALDEALRALKESEEALDAAKDAEGSRETEVAASRRSLEETGRLTERASAGPPGYDDLMQRLDLRLPADPG